MLVMNVSSVAVMWFGGHRIASGQMQIGTLTAFLSYLMQILMAVMMATFMFVMLPRAEVRPNGQRGARHGPERAGSRAPEVRVERTGAGGAARGLVQLSRCRGRCAAWRQPDGQTGGDHRDRRVDRQRQVDVAQPDPASGRRHWRDGDWTTHDVRSLDPNDLRSSIRAGPRSARTCSEARSRRTFATARPMPPTRSCGPRWRSPRRVTSSRRCLRV
jgi:uncharacterized membrane protein